MIHYNRIGQFDFDAEHTLFTDHAVLYVRLITNRNAGTNQTLAGRLTNALIMHLQPQLSNERVT